MAARRKVACVLKFILMLTGLRRQESFGAPAAWGHLMQAAGRGTLLKLLSVLVAFCSSIVFARALGAAEYGVFSFASAWVSLLVIVAGLGAPQLLIREGARNTSALRGMQRLADRRSLIAGTLCAAVLVLMSFFPGLGYEATVFLAAAPLPILLSLGGLRQSLLQVCGWLVRSQWPSLLLMPMVTLSLCVVLWLLSGPVSAMQLMMGSVLGAVAALLANQWQYRRAMAAREECWQAPLRLAQGVPFMLLAGTYYLASRVDLIMLGFGSEARELGIYSVASRSAELLVFVSMASVTAMAPSFAQLHAAGDREQLQSLVKALGRRLVLLTLPPALIMFIFAPQLIQLLYGNHYVDGAVVLQILVVTQFIAVLGGPLGTLLNMSGYERGHLSGVLAGVLLNVVLNSVLAPRYGAIGAATATCCSVLFSRTLLLWQVRRKLGIRPTALGV